MSSGHPAGRVWLLRIGAIGFALFVSLVVGEVGLRIAGVSYPVLVEPEPVAGIRLRPFVEGWFREEGEGYVVANDIGYRDRVHATSKPDGAFRVAFLGDSYTEAMQVALESTWWMQIEDRLGDCAALEGRVPEALNFAISGIGTAQQYEIYRRIARHYDPDLVVVGFVPNDVPNNHRAFGGGGSKPFYDLDEQGRLVLDDSFTRTAHYQRSTGLLARVMRGLTDYSRIAQLVLEARRVVSRREIAATQQGANGSMSGPPEQKKWIEAWSVTEALLAALARTVHDDGRDFLLVAVSSPHQVHPSPEYRRHRLEEVVEGEDLLYWNRRLADLAEREGFAYLSLSEPFQAYAEENELCLHGFENMLPCDGHWNEAGHRLAAEHVERSICRSLVADAG